MSQKDKTEEFQDEFKALLLKYKPTIDIDYAPYDEINGFAICIDDKIAVSISTGYTRYNFGNGLKTLAELEQQTK